MVQYYQEKAAKLFDATGKTLYYHSFHNSFEMECQRNPTLEYGIGWYGLRLSGGNVTKEVAAAIGKLVGVDSPSKAIAALKASPAVYCSAASEYVPSLTSAEFKINSI